MVWLLVSLYTAHALEHVAPCHSVSPHMIKSTLNSPDMWCIGTSHLRMQLLGSRDHSQGWVQACMLKDCSILAPHISLSMTRYSLTPFSSKKSFILIQKWTNKTAGYTIGGEKHSSASLMVLFLGFTLSPQKKYCLVSISVVLRVSGLDEYILQQWVLVPWILQQVLRWEERNLPLWLSPLSPPTLPPWPG